MRGPLKKSKLFSKTTRNSLIGLATVSAMSLMPNLASALDRNGAPEAGSLDGSAGGPEALYLFNAGAIGATVTDDSGNANTLNVADPYNALSMGGGMITFAPPATAPTFDNDPDPVVTNLVPDNSTGGVLSTGVYNAGTNKFDNPGTLLPFYGQCNGNYSIEMWVRPSAAGIADNNGNFIVAQGGDADNNDSLRILNDYNNAQNRLSARAPGHGDLRSSPRSLQANVWHHIYLVKEGNKLSTVIKYEGSESIVATSNINNNGNFRNEPLIIGGHGNIAAGSANRPFYGDIDMMAIYCRALAETEYLGDTVARPLSQPVAVNPNGPSNAWTDKASLLFRRLAGVRTPLDDPRIMSMASLLSQGKKAEAAKIATEDPNFYNITVAHMGNKMATREETYRTTLNDFSATIVGITRDEIDAREMLFADYFYMAGPTKAAVANNMISDILKSNQHYDDLVAKRYSLKRVLEKTPQMAIAGNAGRQIQAATTAVLHPDAAGVLSSRAFLGAHALAGTNRRIIEYTMRQFACIPIEQWADTTGSDNRVGRDVDRYPGGENAKYATTCKGCHSNMDAMRGAVAKIEWNGSNVILGDIFNFGGNGVVGKINRNQDVYPQGYVYRDGSWLNNAIRGANASFFGWRGPTTGSGLKSWGKMISNSKAFPKCMVQKVYRQVCKREVSPFEEQFVKDQAITFEAQGYNMKSLFEQVAVAPECLGKNF